MDGRTRAKFSSSQRTAGSAEALLDGRYRILHLLGEGGMGAVFLAEHVVLGRHVAIKFLHPDSAAKEDMVGRFHREAQAAAAIHHKNIIEVFDVGLSPRGEPFIVMEYLEGESLAELLRRAGPLNLGAACAVVEQGLLALQAAHRKGIIHRDLKPENLFLTYTPGEPPVVKLIDFGISKFTQGDYDKWRTKTGSLLGTPAYMSPEQARALPGLDHRSDLYSMGTIFYEMLTGALPFEGNSFSEFIAKLITEDPRPPQLVRADFPAEAESIVLKALAKDPAARFQSVEEMLEALRVLRSFEDRLDRLNMLASTIQVRGFAAGDLGQILSGKEAEERAHAGGRPWWDASAVQPARHQRRPAIVIAGLAALICVLAAGIWWWFGRNVSIPPVPTAIPTVPPTPVVAVPVPGVPEPAATPPSAERAAETLPEKTTARARDRDERAGRSPSRSKGRHKPVRPLGVGVPAGPAADSSGGKVLRSGGRGTKMSETFE